MDNSSIIDLDTMLFTWLILDRKTSIHLFPLVTCTKQCCQLGSFLTTGTPCLSLVMLSIPLILITINNGNSGSGKTWGFHHAMVHLKMNQKLTLLEAKSVMLALAPKKGIGEVSPGLKCFLAGQQDSCVFPTVPCSRHKGDNLAVEDQIPQSES